MTRHTRLHVLLGGAAILAITGGHIGVATQPQADPVFYVYEDAASVRNHYRPTGYMGDVGDIRLDETHAINPRSGETAIRVVYAAKGRGPNACDYAGPCKWAGVYWQQPSNNWGKEAAVRGRGLDLSAYNRLSFAAKADKPATIEFGVGGIEGPYGDSLKVARRRAARLTTAWQEFTIDLSGADLHHIIGGFSWVTNWDTNPDGLTFYLDDIRFEKK